MSSKRIDANIAAEESFFAKPLVGTLFTVFSGLSFLVLCMVLPLVGKAAVETVHAQANYITFLAILLFSLALAVLATISKLERRKMDGSPYPVFSAILCVLCVLLLFSLLLGLLSI